MGAVGAVAKAMAPHLKPGAILSDVGSVKASVVAAVSPHLPDGVRFVPAHPRGGHRIFRARCRLLDPVLGSLVHPHPAGGTDEAATAQVQAFWEGLGAIVESMTPEHHDLVLAITSHVPHLIAYNIVGTAADLEAVTQSEVIKFSAGGFRDFTRIAASDPTMWRDVFLTNKDAVLEMLGRFNEDLSALARAIRWGDGDALFDLFTRTRAIRRGIVALGQETAEADFGRSRTPPEPAKDETGQRTVGFHPAEASAARLSPTTSSRGNEAKRRPRRRAPVRAMGSGSLLRGGYRRASG